MEIVYLAMKVEVLAIGLFASGIGYGVPAASDVMCRPWGAVAASQGAYGSQTRRAAALRGHLRRPTGQELRGVT